MVGKTIRMEAYQGKAREARQSKEEKKMRRESNGRAQSRRVEAREGKSER